MRITKLEHATLVLEKTGHRLIVDPGGLTNPILDVTRVEAVVITHEHADHWTAQQLERILQRNPDAMILGTEGVERAAADFTVQVVRPGEHRDVGAFDLRFFGGDHAVIHETVPGVENVGVLVDDRLYYPGDSLSVPEGIEVDTLAVPSGAPWLAIGDAMDFIAAVRPKRAFPTHYGVLSVAGKRVADQHLRRATEAVGGEFFPLEPGQALTI